MKTLATAAAGVAIFGFVVSLSAAHRQTGARTRRQPVAAHAAMSTETQSAFVARNCAGCHDDDAKTGGLSLQSFDAANPERNAEVAEKMIRKLRAGMMPPPSAPDRPDAQALKGLAEALEARLDRAALAHPNPGPRSLQRLNRAEYGRAIHDLLDVDVDVSAFLPADTISNGFDNIADAQAFSPTLVEGYLRAASRIVDLALGDKTATATESTYKLPVTESQLTHVEGAPWGTRGGISIVHTFPADGEYTFRVMFVASSGLLYGNILKGEQMEISVNGERAALLTINDRMSEADKTGMNLFTPQIHVKAGPQRISAAFIERCNCPIDDIVAPIDYTLADPQIGEHGYGITTLPHLREFGVIGPISVSGVSETPSRREVFICHPANASEETACATRILRKLATEAYRQPAAAVDVEPLLTFYRQGRAGADFESGIRRAIRAVLVSPRFLFRLEEPPATAKAGQNYRIGDLALASRLSFFLWDAAPDDELLAAARANLLHTPAVLEKQIGRMLKDARSERLSTRFAAQWLRLQDVDKVLPEPILFPAFDHQLAAAFKRETELLFDSIVREDRDVLDLFNADYTFVNERLARHYRIPNVTGDRFRRVTLGPSLEYRRGLLGQGSWLMATSVADRTSPVQRGKWIMEVLLGSPPPPPPPGVNQNLDETAGAAVGGHLRSTRQRMEEHRKSPQCASCHRMIDPLGLALENFDVIGAWRIKDGDGVVDPTGDLYDGTKIDGPGGLRQALMVRSDIVLRTFTENLMSYALGRRVEYTDEPTVRSIVRRASENDHRFSSFVLGIAESVAFQMNRLGPTGTAASALEPRASSPPVAR
jgi:mono/diheme cytochrome c family protein